SQRHLKHFAAPSHELRCQLARGLARHEISPVIRGLARLPRPAADERSAWAPVVSSRFLNSPAVSVPARCGGVVLCSAGAAGAGPAALESASLVLAHTAPHAGVLSGVDRPVQAGLGHWAPAANGLCLFDLHQGGPSVADREEQLGILSETGRFVTPIHAYSPSGGMRTHCCPECRRLEQ